MTKMELVNSIADNVDYALPQDWVNDVIRVLGNDPCPHFVWYYPPTGGVFGMPMPITMDGYHILKAYIAYCEQAGH